ncbi:hypothetical protein Fcan01_04516 [Folsomia candida]|uniref:Uncharacterized protein n=1 Tax=Folsomia candida TaxID=158441 RepID=A0A226ESG4_FOLCA|nr:hypothetical protein Fcan01_04516 [Folsomia candida]
MNVFLFSGVNLLIFAVISPLEGAAFSSNFSAWSATTNNKASSGSERFSRALISQFDSFKREHPIQARILALVSDLLMRPASVHSLLKNSEAEKVNANSQPQAEERIMGPKMMGDDESTGRGRGDDETLLPEASSYQPTYSSYTNVRRSGRFMFPDEYEEKVRRFEAEQERTLGRSSFNNYHIVNNQVRLGRVEAVRKPDVGVGVPFIPRGGGGVRSGRKFEPSVVDGPSTSTSFSSMSDGNNQNQDTVMTPIGDNGKNSGNEFENWRKFGVLPQEQPPQQYSGEVPQMKSLDDEVKVSESEWNPSTTDSFTKPSNPFEYMGSPLQFRRPISTQNNNPVPVLRPIYSSTEGFNSDNNRISRQGKSLNFDVDSQDSEWQLLGTSGQGESTSREQERFIPSPPVGVGTVQIQPASAFSSVEASPKEVPRISKVMRPSTIKSQPLIVKDARDGRSLKEIEVQGVKIIVGAKTPSFPKDIYVRNNYVRSLAPPPSSSEKSANSNVDVSVGSSITTL